MFDRPLVSKRNHEEIVNFINNEWNKRHEDFHYESIYSKLTHCTEWRFDYIFFRQKKTVLFLRCLLKKNC